MRISATGNRCRSAGLTLVEILVVVAIIGLLASVVVLTLPAEKDEAELQARYFAGQLRGARELAITGNRIIGLEVSGADYRFLAYADGEWQTLPLNVNVPRPDAEESELFYTLTVEGLVEPGTAGGERNFFLDDEDDGAEAVQPATIYQPTGEVTPFVVTMSGERSRWRVAQTPGAAIEVRRIDE